MHSAAEDQRRWNNQGLGHTGAGSGSHRIVQRQQRFQRWYVPCRGSAITSSEDGTVRVWDTEELAQAAVIKPTLSKPGRPCILCCRSASYSVNGGLNVGAPLCRGSAITSSEDGTVRVWDTEELAQAAVIKPTLSKPGRVGVTSCRYSPDGLSIAGGLADGSIHIWDVRGEASLVVASMALTLALLQP